MMLPVAARMCRTKRPGWVHRSAGVRTAKKNIHHDHETNREAANLRGSPINSSSKNNENQEKSKNCFNGNALPETYAGREGGSAFSNNLSPGESGVFQQTYEKERCCGSSRAGLPNMQL